nr:hypothetical protein [Tanacetum cinerariifolium]
MLDSLKPTWPVHLDVEVTTAATTPQISKDELTLAQTLIEIKATKPKARGVIVQEPSEFRTTSSSQPSQLPYVKDKGDELEQESAKRHRLEKEDDSAKLKRCLEIVPEDDDDVTIKATPLSLKSPTIVDYKIHKEGKKSYFKIIKADGNSQSYLTFRKMFKNFNREDLEVPWSIVKERFKKTKPVDDMDNLLFQTLKTMFEHHAEDNIHWLKKNSKRTKSDQNRTKTGSVANPGEVKSRITSRFHQTPDNKHSYLSTIARSLPKSLHHIVNMTSLADKAMLSGADNRPPMLEKDMYDSWKSRMELYML